MVEPKEPPLRVSGRFVSKKQFAKFKESSQNRERVDKNDTDTKASSAVAVPVPVASAGGDSNSFNQIHADSGELEAIAVVEFETDLLSDIEPPAVDSDVSLHADDESELNSVESDDFEWHLNSGSDSKDRLKQPGDMTDGLVMAVEKKDDKCDVVEDDVARNDVVDMRPYKRLKPNDGTHRTPDRAIPTPSSSIISPARDFGDTTNSSETGSTPPRPHSSLAVRYSGADSSSLPKGVVTAPSRRSRQDIPPLLSPTLPSSPDSFVNPKLPTSAPPADTKRKKTSIKLIIMDKEQLETLKSHNGILRSHNLSLAKQNADLRAENCKAILLYQEVKDNPLDHTQCVRKTDYQEAIDENDTLRRDFITIREERNLMQECGNEWARMEIAWDTERDLLKTEVTALIERVEELRAREHHMGGEMMKVASRALHMEQLAANETRRVMQLQEEVDRLVAEAKAGPRRGSVYPEL